jgi:hypothetical protein
MTSHKTSWGSKNAEDMFTIATRLAGFDPKELMAEICKRTRGRDSMRVNVNTVTEAMQTICDRDSEYVARRKQEIETAHRALGIIK